MKLLVSIIALLFSYFIYGFYLSHVELKIVPDIRVNENPIFYDYKGAINVRSRYSDGAADPLRVIASAQDANLDFLFITESTPTQTSAPKSNLIQYHGYFERLFVLSGAEYHFLDKRLLLLGGEIAIQEKVHWTLTDWLSQLNPLEREEILIFSTPYNLEGNPNWSGDWPRGINALEIINPKVMSDRRGRQSAINMLWSLLVYPFNPQYAFLRLYQEPKDEILLWDRLTQSFPVVGVSGLDASARAMPFPGVFIEFPSYKTSFEMLSTHLLTQAELSGSYEKDKKLLLSALRQGRSYFSLDLLGNPKGFLAYVKEGNRYKTMGDSIKFKNNFDIQYELPVRPSEFFEVVLVKNGQSVQIRNQEKGSFSITGPGVYRITVRISVFFPLPDARKWVTWIYTNPFYVH